MKASLEDLNFRGNLFTWTNKSIEDSRVCCNLDGALINDSWIRSFLNASAYFDNLLLSNHYPCLVYGGENMINRKVPFKFFNFWADHERFLPIVEKFGKRMLMAILCIDWRFKMHKVELRNINKKEFWNILKRVAMVREDLYRTQQAIS